jgi:ABC-type nitrate/sulfonate/bicarbonate transport system substrate-binding protein
MQSTIHPPKPIYPLLILALLLIGCSTTPVKNTPVPTNHKVQLSWVHTFEFAGLYMAQKQGYFAGQSLNVELLNGGYDDAGNYIDPVEAVVSGKAAFGITGADVILTARADGKPVVAIAAIYQRSPVALIALGDKHVVRPKDLIGKKVATEPGTSLGIAYNALLKSEGIDHTQIVEIPRTDFTTKPLLSGEVDVLLSFITDDGINAKLHDKNTTYVLMSDYGIDIYTNVIFTTEDMIKNKPEQVQGFVSAVVQGLQYAVDNPQVAAQYVLDTYGSSLTPDYKAIQEPGMLASVPLINPIGSPPGMMTAKAWQETYAILNDQKLLPHPVDAETAYTLAFLKKVYAGSGQ